MYVNYFTISFSLRCKISIKTTESCYNAICSNYFLLFISLIIEKINAMHLIVGLSFLFNFQVLQAHPIVINCKLYLPKISKLAGGK